MSKAKKNGTPEKAPPKSISVQIKSGPGDDEGARIDALRMSRTPVPSRGAMVRSLFLFGLAAFEQAEGKPKGRRS